MIRFAPAIACLALALTACTTSQAPMEASAPAESTEPMPSNGTGMRVPEGAMQEDPAAPSELRAPPAMSGDCDAAPAKAFVGKQSSPDILMQARTAAGAKIARTLKPGQMVTMEFSAQRLNLDVDAQGVITGVRCG